MDEMCPICLKQTLTVSPAIRLSCGHVVHYKCCTSSLEQRWRGPRISFGFIFCPICHAAFDHPLLKNLLKPLLRLKDDLEERALKQLEYDDSIDRSEITTPGGKYYNRPANFAVDKYVYFQCHNCFKPYFVGDAVCQLLESLNSMHDFDPEECLCGGCSNVIGASRCIQHGTDCLQYKCRFCCSMAAYFFDGSIHCCISCREIVYALVKLKPGDLRQCPTDSRNRIIPFCPLQIPHSPSGVEFCFRCSDCNYCL
ncbi:unnamed protein product [Soboliphyme baturini]|uniref:RING-type domain-containing protein n=1 Tax=Soboliphyme baturini TaxID=241478 RepID=A0A183J3K9_9BILA|nr:unnamed protein product [Soboliphyme baturini]